MTVKEYWEGDNALPLFYLKSYKMRKKQELDHENLIAWLQGQYIAEAIATCLSKNHSYPKEPFNLKKEDIIRNPPKSSKERQKVIRNAVEGFAAFVAAKNAERHRKLKAQENVSENKSAISEENSDKTE